jgi:hypothetical protein
MSTLNPRRRGRRFLVGTIIIVALLWSVYWYAASRIAGAGLERIAAALAARGGSVTCTEQGMGGFPLALDLRCSGGKLADSGSQMAAGLQRINASAPLYSPGSVAATLTGPFIFDAPAFGVALTASWTTASADATAWLDGVQKASAAVDGLTLEQTGAAPRLPFRRVGARHADFAAMPAADDGYRLAASASDIIVEQTSGQALPSLSGSLDVTAEHFGGALGTDPRGRLADWVAKGGAVKVDRLVLTAGPVTAQASGKLTLSPSGLLSGTLTVRLFGLEQVPALAEELRPGSGDKATRMIGAMAIFLKPVDTAAGPARETLLTIRDGAVAVGIIPIPGVRIPPLKL